MHGGAHERAPYAMTTALLLEQTLNGLQYGVMLFLISPRELAGRMTGSAGEARATA